MALNGIMVFWLDKICWANLFLYLGYDFERDDNVIAAANCCLLVAGVNCDTLSSKYVYANKHFSLEAVDHMYFSMDCFSKMFVFAEV